MAKKIKILDRHFHPAGETIFEEGEPGDRAYFIEKGAADVFMKDRRGRNVKIANIRTGSIFGEMAALLKQPRSATVVTSEDSILVGISSGDINKMLDKTDIALKCLIKILVQRLRNANLQYLAKQGDLAVLEENIQTTVKNISLTIPKEKQTGFRKEVLPQLEKIKTTLKKYMNQ